MPTAHGRASSPRRCCEGLDYAHRKKDARGQALNIVHRDVSPQNILVSYEGEVKIIDFGIAKAANRRAEDAGRHPQGQVRLHVARAGARAAARPPHRHLLGRASSSTRCSPASGCSSARATSRRSRRCATSTCRRRGSSTRRSPPGLEKIVLKALAREAEDRYQWASDLQDDLMRFLLAGEAIYSAKHLATFMKEAFAEDLLREAEKMERFAEVERPDQIESSGVSTRPGAPPPQAPAPAPKKKPTVQTPARSPRRSAPGGAAAGRRTSQPVAVSSGSGAMAVGLQGNAAVIDIPPPTEEELAEMEQGGERTVMADARDPAPGRRPARPPARLDRELAPAGRLRPGARRTSATSSTQDNLARPRQRSAPSRVRRDACRRRPRDHDGDEPAALRLPRQPGFRRARAAEGARRAPTGRRRSLLPGATADVPRS